MKKKSILTAALLSATALVSACASSSTTQMAQNVIRIDISTAPACGSSGAGKLVNRMAAVETIRLGYDNYIIAALDSQNNVRVIGVNYNTTGTFSTFGNSTTYTGTTTSTPIISGSRDAALIAIMYRKNEPEAKNAIDARRALRPEWQEIVAKGSPTTCLN